MDTQSDMSKEIDALRPKMWKDLSDVEKINRLREQVKQKDWNIGNLNQRVYALEELVKNHMHMENGEVVQKVKSTGLGGALTAGNSMKSLSANPDDVYF